jgi:HNH endonuclease
MEEFLRLRNFRQFERTGREVKLPCELLDDLRFRQLTDAHKAHLICLLLLAARMDNLLPNRPVKLERLIGASESLDLGALSEFLDFTRVDRPAHQDRRASRRLAASLRAAVLARDQGRCRRCRRATDLEIDHIVPVSRGGSSEESNLQTLCRRCNRRKWKKLTPRF